MPRIAFPTSTAPGDRASEGGGRLINARAEQVGEGARSPIIIHRTPGLVTFAEAESRETPRGMIAVGASLFVAYENELSLINAGGDISTVGLLTGAEPVYFARNNKTPVPDILALTESTVYEVATDSVSELVDEDLPSPNSICFLDGYFFFTIGDGRVFASGLNDVTINALDFARAESSPGGLTRGVAFEGRLFLFGPSSIEVWANTAEPEGFPFTRATVVSRGLASPRAVAGFEANFTKDLIWVGDDNSVHALVGYQAQKISPPELDTLIEAVEDKTDLEASVHAVDGHPYWILSSQEWTWAFDLSTRAWHEKRSYEKPRWRATYSAYFAGQWLVADRDSGDVLKLDSEVFTEAGEPLVFEVESVEMHGFPRRIAVSRADFDFVVGVGDIEGLDPIQAAPQVAISWADDGGYNWSHPLLRGLGRQAETKARVSVNRTGLTGPQGRRWRVSVSDPVYVGLLGGFMRVEGEDVGP